MEQRRRHSWTALVIQADTIHTPYRLAFTGLNFPIEFDQSFINPMQNKVYLLFAATADTSDESIPFSFA
jgi:hypothetical protein